MFTEGSARATVRPDPSTTGHDPAHPAIPPASGLHRDDVRRPGNGKISDKAIEFGQTVQIRPRSQNHPMNAITGSVRTGRDLSFRSSLVMVHCVRSQTILRLL